MQNHLEPFHLPFSNSSIARGDKSIFQTMPIVNSNIKIIRLLRDIPVKEAANSLSISSQAYSKIESGKTVVSIAHKTKLAQCFKVPVEIFETFNVDDILPPPPQ